MRGSMAQIFLTFARRDLGQVRPIIRALETAGMTVWWDRRHHGAEISPEIQAELESADAVVVIWSANGIRSHYVHDEAERGRDSNKLVSASLDGSDVPLGFRNLHTVDLLVRRNIKGAKPIDELVDAVADQLEVERLYPARKSVRELASSMPAIIIAVTVAIIAAAAAAFS